MASFNGGNGLYVNPRDNDLSAGRVVRIERQQEGRGGLSALPDERRAALSPDRSQEKIWKFLLLFARRHA
ncbi:MAG: hypothetical protein QME60_07655 [Verrucomicrobiota bacterium]|nr:hypothetical protein [Verrucomicrobiota bacterium]